MKKDKMVENYKMDYTSTLDFQDTTNINQKQGKTKNKSKVSITKTPREESKEKANYQKQFMNKTNSNLLPINKL